MYVSFCFYYGIATELLASRLPYIAASSGHRLDIRQDPKDKKLPDESGGRWGRQGQ